MSIFPAAITIQIFTIFAYITVTCFILAVWNSPSSARRHCHLHPSSIESCSGCIDMSLPRILTTCNLLDLKHELTVTEQLLIAHGERLFHTHTEEPVSALHNFAVSPRDLSHASLLQDIFYTLEDFLFKLNIIRHNNAIILLDNVTRNTTELESRIVGHLCAVRSLLNNEKQLFDRDLEVPSCSVSTNSTWVNKGTTFCIRFSKRTFKTAVRNLRQILLDLGDLLPDSQL